MDESREKEFDAIIVGTGPGGATVARELARRGKKVLMLERGGDAPIKGTPLQALGMAGIPGRSFLITNGFLGMVRAITLGGSSVIYYGTAFDPPLALFKAHGVDITAEVDEARRELPIAPLNDDLMGPMAKRMMESARGLGYEWRKLNKFVYQDKCRPDCDKCNYGCPHGAKWSARMYVEEALQNGAVLRARATVTKVLVEGGRAVGVEYSSGGDTRTAHAGTVVVAAGGIGTPVVLRNTGIREAGYDYFFDPLICVMGTVRDIRGGKEFPMASGIHMEDEGYVMTDMTIPWPLYMAFSAQVFRFDRIFSHSRTLQIMIKAKDGLGGSITAGGGIRKPLTPSDREKLMKGYGRAKKILENAGARHIFKSWYLAAHPGGTAKIGEIVNTDLKTGIDNLYVCDCSVIPEAWGLPPTLSIIALGKRLAKHLAGEA